MIKSELIERITAQNQHLYQRDIEKVVNAILDEMVEALRRGDRVELRGFGAFSAKIRAARTGRNPKTGAAVAVGKRALPFFKAGKEMRARLNRETVRLARPQAAPLGLRQPSPSTSAAARFRVLLPAQQARSGRLHVAPRTGSPQGQVAV